MILAAVFLAGVLVGALVVAFVLAVVDRSSVRRPGYVPVPPRGGQ